MAKGSFTDFENALRAFESGVDKARYQSGQISEGQLREWIGDHNFELLQSGKLSWREAQYKSVNSLGFVGYQVGEALLIDLGYYKDDDYYGHYASTNSWDGTFTGRGDVDNLSDLKSSLQEGVMLDAFAFNLGIIKTGLANNGMTLDDVVGTTRTGNDGVAVKVTLTGILASAHLRGAYGTLDLLVDNTGSTDEYGTSILKYMKDFGGYTPIDINKLFSAREHGKTLALAETIWNLDFNHDGKIGGKFHFTEKADVVTGSSSADSFHALGGKDIVHGAKGNDAIFGDDGEDRLFGDAGKDTLSGGSGNDRLTGGAGADTLTGGSGEDRFLFTVSGDSSGSGIDLIKDFGDHGHDLIDLSAFAGTLEYRDEKGFSGLHQVHVEAAKGGDVLVEVNLTSAHGAELVIRLDDTRLSDMAKGDFIL